MFLVISCNFKSRVDNHNKGAKTNARHLLPGVNRCARCHHASKHGRDDDVDRQQEEARHQVPQQAKKQIDNTASPNMERKYGFISSHVFKRRGDNEGVVLRCVTP